jgi:hypothetical protein
VCSVWFAQYATVRIIPAFWEQDSEEGQQLLNEELLLNKYYYDDYVKET